MNDRKNPQPNGGVEVYEFDARRSVLSRLLRRIPRPRVAWPGMHLWRIVLHGFGFELDYGPGQAATGFYTTRYVAARSEDVAKDVAVAHVRREWTRDFARRARGALMLEVETVDCLSNKYLPGPGSGMSFYAVSAPEPGARTAD